MKKIYTVLLGIFMIGGCASDVDLDAMSAEDLYNLAYDNLEATKYAKAAEMFEKVETDHPYSQWAVKSKLMGAFAYYKDEKYDEAVMAVDRFIKYHPGNKDVPYALYLKGMCYYDQISAADKDQGDTELAADTFKRLITLYPESKYAKDVMGKMSLTEDYKAGQEMIIGRYYLKEGNYLSALNRFNVVLENYQTTIQIEEALYRQVEIYAILGLNSYADGYYKILNSNYPNGKWTAKAAKIMEKIGKDKESSFNSKPVIKVEEVKAEVIEPAEEKKGWFSGWFGSDKDEAKEEVVGQVEEVKVEVEEPVEEKKGWFSGWFGSDKDDAKEEVVAEVEEVKIEVEEPAEEKKGWFSGLFSGGTLIDSEE